MNKNMKILLAIITLILTLGLTWFLATMNIMSEFKNHLSEKYPEQRFAVGFVKYEPLYNNYYAEVTCIDDSIAFRVSKNSYTKEISDYYSGVKRAGQYNSKIKAIFDNSDLKDTIMSVSGFGNSPFSDDGVYTQIDFSINENADMISVVTKTITILKENNISAEVVGIHQEKDNHLYVLTLSPADYSLSRSELQSKIVQRK